eukprot:TRINITY_DN10730_c0_g1_i1.p1 TRINITY_DN10730_c0_g1~~TRINITY_DN10730_c0_g1_i1.p1  ORF type:complete len:819 (-),score=226.07 TRINITY_DN10730_c0_g1_i1:124-2556(-)
MLANSPLLTTLEYGPAPESPSAVNDWIKARDGKFGLFIGGEFVFPEGRAYTDSVSPSTGEVLGQVIEGDPTTDVDAAVTAARTAYGSWSALSGHKRAKHLYAIARHIQKHGRILAVLEALDNGKTIRETRDGDVPLAARHFYHHAGWAQLMDSDHELREQKALGVVAQVIPWNFPLLMLAWKIAPALAMGNTVVLKPAPTTCLTAILFAEICIAAGLPAGVVNIIPGGNDLGQALITHSDVDKVAFTGSTGVGRLLREVTAGSGKKLSLELGGKSPFLVFEDADLDAAVEGVVDAIWYNAGQVCCAGSRLLVQESVYDLFLAKLKTRMDHLRIGSCLDKCTDVGAINSERQLNTIKKYIDIAKAEGCSVYQSAKSIIPEVGFYYPPTLIHDVQTSHTVVVEEIFGPVVTMMPFRSPAEAVKLANNTAYGLASSVWSETLATCLDISFQIKAGVVWVNCHNRFDAAAGFGGYKESGFGREGGREGLFEYVKPKWQQSVRNTFTDEEKAATFGNPTPPGPLAAGTGRIHDSIDRTYKMYVGGRQARPDGNYQRSIKGASGAVVGEVGEANRKDVRNAVEAAHGAAGGWGKRAAHNRAQILYFVAENLDIRRDEFAKQIDAMTGCGAEKAKREVELSIERLFYWAAFADKCGGQVQETTLYGATVAIHEAVGVVGIACPDEYPLLGFVSLFAPAIVRGNTVVVVPSEKYPLSATDLYQVFETSDLPGGVINILTGSRDLIAMNLAKHMDVQSMWYFGSAIGSYHMEKASACNLKRTFVNYGKGRDWADNSQGQGKEFLYHSVQVKNIWMPAGV